jgi:hypothetical protein
VAVGSVSDIPVISVDAKGRVTGLTTVPNVEGTVRAIGPGEGLLNRNGGGIPNKIPIYDIGELMVDFGTGPNQAAMGNDARFDTIPAPSNLSPSPDSNSPVVGTSTAFARADHSHPKAVTAITGDVVGSGTETINAQLISITSAQSNVGSLTQIPQISVDAKGRVTSLTTVANPQTAITSLSGDVVATGPGAASAQLSASGVLAGTYGFAASGRVASITVDSKGRIGAASDEAIVLPTEKQSSTNVAVGYGVKSFTFSNATGVVPYFVNQAVTAFATNNQRWMSGFVTACTTNSVSIAVVSIFPLFETSFNSWRIRPGLNLQVDFAGAAPGQVLAFDGLGRIVPSAGGSANATAIQGRDVSATAPDVGNALIWNGSTWSPSAPSGGSSTIWNSTTAYQPGEIVSTTSSDPAWVCVQANTNNSPTIGSQYWSPIVANAFQLQGNDVSQNIPNDGDALVWDDALQQWKPTAGGAGTDATALQGTAVSTVAPTNGQGLVFDGTAWAPAVAASNATQLQGTAIATEPNPNALEVLTWAQISTGGGDYEWRPRPLPNFGNATALQTTPVSATAPAASQGLVFNGTDWVPTNVLNVSQYSGSPSSQGAPAGWMQVVVPGQESPCFVPFYV